MMECKDAHAHAGLNLRLGGDCVCVCGKGGGGGGKLVDGVSGRMRSRKTRTSISSWGLVPCPSPSYCRMSTRLSPARPAARPCHTRSQKRGVRWELLEIADKCASCPPPPPLRARTVSGRGMTRPSQNCNLAAVPVK